MTIPSLSCCILLVSLPTAAFGQVVVIDNFNSGDFSESGPGGGTFEITGSSADIVGATRRVNIATLGSFSVSVGGGEFTAAGSVPGAQVGLLYGTKNSLDLNLDSIPNGGFWVNVLASSVPQSASFRFSVSTGNFSSVSPTVNIATPGNYFFAFSSFTPLVPNEDGADFKDIERINFSGSMLGLGPATITLGQITASPVPEPETYAMIAGIGLVGFGLWRRRQGSSIAPSV
jgi:PEP-CTERM motif